MYKYNRCVMPSYLYYATKQLAISRVKKARQNQSTRKEAMNRWKAAAIHLTISFALATTVTAILYFVWFPAPYFAAAGASRLILILVAADLCIGPLLTLLVVSPTKSRKLLKVDLAVIGVLQTIALAYGVHVIAAARPVFVVGAVDRLVLVSAEEVEDADLAQGSQPEFRKRSWFGPVLVGVERPTGIESIRMANQAMRSGKDLELLPRFYVPYDQVSGKLMHRAKPLSLFKHASSQQIKSLQARFRGEMPVGLPLQRGDQDYTVLMSPTTQRPILITSIDPW